MKKLEYREAIREAIIEEMDRDSRVFLIGEDIGVYGNIFRTYKGLLDKYGPDRVINTPISEATITGAGIGAALTGYRPVVEIMYVDFTALAMDQIVNQAAKIRYMTGDELNVPLVIRTQGGSGNGVAAQHSQSLEAWFYHIPGLKVVCPATPYDVKGLLKTAIREDNPVIFIEHKMIYQQKGDVPDGEYTIPFGQAEVKREGKDITVVTYSQMLFKALSAAEKLEEEGISCEIIDLRTLVPLDLDTIIQSVIKTNHLVIITEAYERGSIASDISAKINREAFDHLDAPVEIIAGLNTPIPFNSTLEKASIPQTEGIAKIIKDILNSI